MVGITTHRVTFVLVRTWRHLILRGLLAIGIAAVAFLNPGAVGTVLNVLGVVILIDGILTALIVIAGSALARIWPLLVVLALWIVGVGIYALLLNRSDAASVSSVLWAWGLARGILDLAIAVMLRIEVRNFAGDATGMGFGFALREGVAGLAISGLAGLAFASALIMPQPAALGTLFNLLGTLSLVSGAGLVIAGLGMRKRHRWVEWATTSDARINFITIK